MTINASHHQGKVCVMDAPRNDVGECRSGVAMDKFRLYENGGPVSRATQGTDRGVTGQGVAGR